MTSSNLKKSKSIMAIYTILRNYITLYLSLLQKLLEFLIVTKLQQGRINPLWSYKIILIISNGQVLIF
jgi:hypothetical protein